jgi:hypothetical protein
MEINPVDPEEPAEPELYFGSLVVPDGGFVGRQGGLPLIIFDYGNEALQLGGTNIFGVGSMTINGTADIGLDMSGGTFADAIQKWPGGTIQSTGDIVFQPTADSTTAFQWKDSSGDVVGNFDTSNKRFGVGTNAPSGAFSVGSAPGEDAYFFYDNDDVGDSTSGQALWLYRRAAEGDGWFKIFILHNNNTIIDTSEDKLFFDCDLSLFTSKEFRFGSSLPYWSHIGTATVYDIFQQDTSNVTQRLFRNYGDETSMQLGGYIHITPDDITQRPETAFEVSDAEPYLTLHNITHEDSDGRRESRINFKGEQSGGEETTLARIQAQHDGAADDEKGEIIISTNDGSDGDTPTDRIKIDSAGTVTIGDLAGNDTTIDSSGNMVFLGGGGLAFAEIYAHDAADTLTIAASGVANKVQVTSFDTNGQSNNMTPDHTNDHITVDKAGMYLCTVSVSALSAAGAGYELGISLWKNNGATEFDNVHSHRDLSGGGGDTGSITLSGIVDLAVNDTMEIWVWNETNTTDVIIDDITFSLVQIGGT